MHCTPSFSRDSDQGVAVEGGSPGSESLSSGFLVEKALRVRERRDGDISY